MSNQPELENQQFETLTPEEVRQALLAEIEATRQAIAELSDEQIEEITGGGLRGAVVGAVQGAKLFSKEAKMEGAGIGSQLAQGAKGAFGLAKFGFLRGKGQVDYLVRAYKNAEE